MCVLGNGHLSFRRCYGVLIVTKELHVYTKINNLTLHFSQELLVKFGKIMALTRSIVFNNLEIQEN